MIVDAYLLPTPGGAFQAASTPAEGPSRTLLFRLMEGADSRRANPATIARWLGVDSEDEASDLLYRMQEMALVQGEDQSREVPSGPLDEVLPELLRDLSDVGKAMLVDDQGLYIASQGFAHETAEELGALTADLASLYERQQRLLKNNLGLTSEAWGIIDAAGNSRIGFWPLYIGHVRFVLVAAGVPQFNQAAFRDVVWALTRRYAFDEAYAR